MTKLDHMRHHMPATYSAITDDLRAGKSVAAIAKSRNVSGMTVRAIGQREKLLPMSGVARKEKP